MEHSFQIKELNENLIEPLVQYWTQSGDDHLISMGVDINKKPKAEELRQMLRKQCSLPDHQKSSLAFIVFQDTTPLGIVMLMKSLMEVMQNFICIFGTIIIEIGD